MEKVVVAAGKAIKLKASALTPRLYRTEFGRDLLIDISAVISGKTADGFPASIEIYENIAYVMAKQAGDTHSSIAEWLNALEANAVYELIPAIIDLWAANEATTAEIKKNKE